MSKICKDCLQPLPESEFYASPNTVDGLKGDCKSCYRAKRNERHRLHYKVARVHYTDDLAKAERVVGERPRSIAPIASRPRQLVRALSYAGLIDHLFRAPKRDPRRRASA